MSQDKGNFKGRRGHGNTYRNKPKANFGDAGKEALEGLDEDSPIIKQFKEYAIELDKKHDKYEKIVKVSRDITIESKRIIFLLHTIDRESKRDAVLAEAEKRLNSLVEVMFKKVALELDGEDPYLYLKAYRAGFQEFIEALTFFHYLKDKTLHGWVKVAESMVYTVKDQSEAASEECANTEKSDVKPSIPEHDNAGIQEGESNSSIQKSDETPTTQEKSDETPTTQEKSGETPTTQESNDTPDIQESSNDEVIERKVKVLVAPTEYILGIADLTGELMRKCINNLSTGDIDSCFQTCNFVRQMYVGFLSCAGISGREVSRKLYTLKQSLTKMENVCYTIKLRGSEIPKHMLAHVAMSCTGEVSLDDDEGYQM